MQYGFRPASRHAAALLASVALLSLAAPAFAAAPAVAPEVSAAPEPEASPDEPVGVGTIVVTATKRETDLQRTPISMSVMSAANLQERHVQSLLDLGDGSIPGLRVATFEARQSALTIGIRGIVPLDANQPAREQGVGVYIDGVYLGRQQGLNASLMDVERIEVLKGPQGTLFGRNTEGGAVNMITRQPSGQFGFRATAGFGNYGSYHAAAHLDLPEFHNFSLKLDGALQYRGPTVENPLAGQTGWNYYDRKGGKVTLKWEPSSSFKATYSYDNSKDQNSPFYSQLVNYNPLGYQVVAPGVKPGAGQIAPLPPIVVVSGGNRMDVADIGVPQQPSVDKSFGHTLHLNWKVSPDLELRSITAYREVSVEQWDNSGGAHRVPAFSPGANFSRYSLAGMLRTAEQYSTTVAAG